MKKSKFSLLLVFLLVLTIFVSACSGKQSSDKGTASKDSKQEATILESQEMPAMDTIQASDTISFTTMNNVFEGLYRFNDKEELVPGMADGEPVANKDKTVYNIKIKDAKWSNGDPVKAQDFVYAWQRALDPEQKSEYGPYMMVGKIKNADKVYNKKAKPEELGIKAVSDKELQITLEKPIPYFQSLLSFPTFYPVNEKFVKEQGDKYAKTAKNLVYNGPFELSSWDGPQATTWEYKKNEEYWDKKNVSMTKLTFKVSKDPQAAVNAFEAGEADITPKLSTPAIISQYEGDKRMKRLLEPTVFWLKMNQGNKSLKNENVRRAIATAIDKEAFVNDVLQNGSVAAYYQIPKDFVHDESGKDFRDGMPKYLETNKDEAKKLFEKGLKELGTSKVTLNYLGDDSETAKTIGAFIKDQLEKTLPGLDINIQSVPFATRIDRDKKEDYDLQMAGWGPDYLDPITFSDLFITGGGNNHMGYSDKKYDQLLKDASGKLAAKPEERWKALQEAEKVLLQDDAALSPIYQRATNYLINNKVKGFVIHKVGPEFSYKWMKIEG
ncbi:MULTISPECIES: peptide ABC transporter substrate-binding protein [Bacillus]|uniref:Peptide ABC transporter substrate-binding protein n=1 Tax=Bacillus sp. BS1807G30 TaxID=3153756 RepID=A0AAU7FP18_9BACI|nr:MULTISPECIES: peptide ABC transporter substrate-binding protein [Bacillus]KOA82248.1 peptide ABC transporter substrate-binding protein [Bacillus stratosphericus]MDH8709857.1 oligopeptide transport system substrate-binding protein [Micromonospora sp. 1209]UJM28763.1 peptide ABC transporter substrate-binding protein [Bacillus aerophilus]CVM63437.1 oligopeptide ABC transporter substrate-binding protein [Streptococcus pneumoniae]BAT48217.1 oligopeptide ABC transporter substrate-binding protein 